MSLQVGTASFANKYGLVNKNILNDDGEIKQIIKFCLRNNLIMDSSPTYGSSLNSIVNNVTTERVKISTKVIISNDSINQFSKSLIDQIKSLQLCDIDTIYFHEPQISHNIKFNYYLKEAYNICQDFKIPKIGLSIYQPSDICADNFDLGLIDIIQCPINLLDFSNLVLFKKFPKLEIVARSIFLQGMLTKDGIGLLLNSTNKEDRFNAREIIRFASKHQVDVETFAMAGVLTNKCVKTLLVGVNSYKQLLENFAFYKQAQKLAEDLLDQSVKFETLSQNGSIFKRWWSKLAPK